MAMSRVNLTAVGLLCSEVQRLVVAVQDEMVEQGRSWHEHDPNTFPKGYEPSTAPGSPTTGELRRRSMDLTRALSRLRS